MEDRIRVILTDDHTIIRDGIKALLQEEDLIQVVGEAASSEELLLLLPHQPVEVILMDIKMPGNDVFQTVQSIKGQYPTTQVLALTMLENEHYIVQMLKAGAMGYLLKNVGKHELLHAIKMVAMGETYISTDVTLNLLSKYCGAAGPVLKEKRVKNIDDLPDEISKREMEVLVLIAEGYTNAEIAEKLFTSKRTIETHRQNLLEKTHTKNTASLIKYAFTKGILQPDK